MKERIHALFGRTNWTCFRCKHTFLGMLAFGGKERVLFSRANEGTGTELNWKAEERGETIKLRLKRASNQMCECAREEGGSRLTRSTPKMCEKFSFLRNAAVHSQLLVGLWRANLINNILLPPRIKCIILVSSRAQTPNTQHQQQWQPAADCIKSLPFQR